MIEYFVVFFIVLFCSIVGSFVQSNFTKGLLCFISAMSICLLGGLRWEIWTDWPMYYKIFLNPFDVTQDFEIGFIWVNQIFNVFGIDYSAFLVLYYAVLILVIIKITREYSKDYYPLVLVVYFSLFLLTSGGMRQHIALFFFLCSLKFIVNRKLVNFLMVIILGSFFHRTILFFVPFYWLARIELSIWIIGISICIGIVFAKLDIMTKIIGCLLESFGVGGSFMRRVDYYSSMNYGIIVGGIGTIRKILFLLVNFFSCYCYKYKGFKSIFIETEDTYLNAYKKILTIYFLGVVLSLFIYGIFGRMLVYMYFVECLLFPLFLSTVKFKYRILTTIVMVLMYGLSFVQSMHIFDSSATGVGGDFYVPYKSCFDYL